MNNDTPSYSWEAKQFESHISAVIAQNEADLNAFSTDDTLTPHSFILKFEALDIRLNQYWSMLSHLHSVKSTPEIREVYDRLLPKIVQYSTQIFQNTALYQLCKKFADEIATGTQTPLQRVFELLLRQFKCSGAALNAEEKKRFMDVEKQLSQLSSHFSENILDSSDHYFLKVTDSAQLKGIPEDAIARAKVCAEKHNAEGFWFTLEHADYLAVLTYAESSHLREAIYKAYITRASDVTDCHEKKWDNSDLMVNICKLRQEMAALLNFNDYAAFSLDDKMAKSVDKVFEFLEPLRQRAYAKAKAELQELTQFAAETYPDVSITSWNLPFLSEKLKQKQFSFNEEMLKPYFSLPHVLNGLFEMVHRLFGITLKPQISQDVWHESVRVYDIVDENNHTRGQIYMDLYARPLKQDGAWMVDAVARYKNADNHIQNPIAYLICNFAQPVNGKPVRLSHEEVETLFHECGHCLHHVLTQMDQETISGISGVEWDAVELPSQFLEQWCWQKEALDLFAVHDETHEKLPASLFDSLLASRHFHSGLMLLKQIEYSMFDMQLHIRKNVNNEADIQQLMDEVRTKTALVKPPSYNRFAHGFSHIFSGGYSAGYYSYLWAELLSSDAFVMFEQNGIFDQKTGRHFLNTILEQGGSKPAAVLYKTFRGADPHFESLLKNRGILEETPF